MGNIIGNVVVIAILAAAVALAVRHLWKQHKSGGCGCGCPGCDKKSCH